MTGLSDPRETDALVRVVHVNDKVPNAVYIGRATRIHPVGSSLGNPFKIGRDGDRALVIDKYEDWLMRMIPQYPILVDALIALRGKPLACWCRHDGQPRTPSTACHGDVLLALLDQNTDDELRELAMP